MGCGELRFLIALAIAFSYNEQAPQTCLHYMFTVVTSVDGFEVILLIMLIFNYGLRQSGRGYF